MTEGTPEFEAKMGRLGRIAIHKEAMFKLLCRLKDVLDMEIPIVPFKDNHAALKELVDLIEGHSSSPS